MIRRERLLLEERRVSEGKNGVRPSILIPVKTSESRSSSTVLTAGDPATLINVLRYLSSWTPASRGSALSTLTGKNLMVFHRNLKCSLNPLNLLCALLWASFSSGAAVPESEGQRAVNQNGG